MHDDAAQPSESGMVTAISALKMNRIITVTLNPAIDRITEVADFHVGGVQKAREAHVYPAGKGVNVARALSCMGYDVTAIAVIGAANVEFFETVKDIKGPDPALEMGKITTEWILTSRPTRTNNTFIDPVRGTETHVREVVETHEEFPMAQVKAALEKHCGEGDAVIFAGSLPSNAPADTLSQLCNLCRSKGAKVVVDTSGEALKDALKASPDLVKPNVEELQEFVGHRFYTKNEIVNAARELVRDFSVPYVLVSMGEEGAVIASADGDCGNPMLSSKAYQAMFMLPLTQTQHEHGLISLA